MGWGYACRSPIGTCRGPITSTQAADFQIGLSGFGQFSGAQPVPCPRGKLELTTHPNPEETPVARHGKSGTGARQPDLVGRGAGAQGGTVCHALGMKPWCGSGPDRGVRGNKTSSRRDVMPFSFSAVQAVNR